MSDPIEIQVQTDDGVAPCWVHRPPGEAALPGVVMYPDAGSVRPTMHAMAARLAGLGYVVLMPHLFYRAGAYEPFDVRTVFTDPPERERLMKIVRALDLGSAMRDAGHYLAALRAQPGVAGARVGCMGYCIGGRLAFATAGAHPGLVAAAASIHGGGVATDAADSPHLQAEKIEARLYFAIADDDGSCTPAQQGQLVAALAAAHVDFTAEHFRGAKHGFAMPDFPVYVEDAAERHWDRVRTLFAATLPGR